METNTTSKISNSLRDYELFLEKHVVIMLKDNRFYYGIFKSYDQYNSVTLNYSVERIFYKNSYAEKFQGLLILRGDTISLIGISNNDFKRYNKLDYDEIIKLQKENE